jgi:DNA-binding transcriptional regulator PaaX
MRQPGIATKKILQNIGWGLLGVIAYSSPSGAGRINSYIFTKTKKLIANNWRKRMKELHQKGYIELGDEEIKLTRKGIKLLETLSLPEPKFDPKKWDHRWRIVTYDIPEEKKKGRDILHNILKKWGCVEIQKSVFLTPFECKEEVAIATKEYHLNSHIFYFVTSEILNEKKYRRHYNLDKY